MFLCVSFDRRVAVTIDESWIINDNIPQSQNKKGPQTSRADHAGGSCVVVPVRLLSQRRRTKRRRRRRADGAGDGFNNWCLTRGTHAEYRAGDDMWMSAELKNVTTSDGSWKTVSGSTSVFTFSPSFAYTRNVEASAPRTRDEEILCSPCEDFQSRKTLFPTLW